MLSRRAMLGRISALLFGGGAIGTVTGRETAAHDWLPTDSDVSITLNSSALERTAIPPSLESRLEDAEQFTGISLTDVDRISATATTREGEVARGRASITGQFDVGRIVERLQSRRPDFEREHVRGGEETRYRTDDGAVEKHPTVLVDRRESVAVSITQSRLLVATGMGPDDALSQFSREHETESTNRRAFDVPGTTLAGDAVARVTLREDARGHIAAHSEQLPTPVVRLLRAMSTGGVAVDVGSETSELRYALEFTSDAEISPAVGKLIDKTTAHRGVERIRSDSSENHFIVDLSVETDSLWRAHDEVLTGGGGTRF